MEIETTVRPFTFYSDQADYSAFHRIKQDEIWHFYLGSTLLLHTINVKGDYTRIRIGNNISEEEVPQYVVPAGTWFASELENKNVCIMWMYCESWI